MYNLCTMNLNTLTPQNWLDDWLDRADRSNDVKTKVDMKIGLYIRTPWNLCDEIVQQVKNSVGTLAGKTILVVDTLEFIPVLLTHGAEKCKITYIAPYDFKGRIAKWYGAGVIQASLLEWENKNNMKFDVVIGNPPYQLTTSKKLWPGFVLKSLNLTITGGLTSLVIPSSWMTSNSSSFKKVRESLTSENNLKKVSRNANTFFEVGQDIVYFISHKEEYRGETCYVDDNNNEHILDLRAARHISENEKFIDNIILKIIDEKYPKIPLITEENLPSSSLQKVQSDKYCYRCIYSTSNIGYIDKPMGGYGKLKIGLNYSSSYFSCKTNDNNMPITTDCIGSLMAYYVVSSTEEGMKMKSYLSSKVIRFLVNNYKKKNTGFSDAVKRRMIPFLENKFWTDLELYSYFNLTQDEIDYIEETIK